MPIFLAFGVIITSFLLPLKSMDIKISDLGSRGVIKKRLDRCLPGLYNNYDGRIYEPNYDKTLRDKVVPQSNLIRSQAKFKSPYTKSNGTSHKSTTCSAVPQCNGDIPSEEKQVKAMIQSTYRKLSEDFKRLEELMKKQEEVEKKANEEKAERVEGINNIITIENIHSSHGNYTKVTLSKRKVLEVRHKMPLPTLKPTNNLPCAGTCASTTPAGIQKKAQKSI